MKKGFFYIPCAKIYEDDKVLAFDDIHPMAPVHVIIIPKKHISTLLDIDAQNIAIAGDLISTAQKIAKIKGDIQENLNSDSEYKFGIDAQKMLTDKYNDLVFPDAFLKRWVLSSNENITPETLEEDFPKMIENLKWQLIKNKLEKANDVKVDKDDIDGYARKMAKAQFAQYGMIGMDDEIIANYAKDMMKKEETLRNVMEKVAEEKVLASVKESVKLENKEITIEEFNKMFEEK